MDIHSLKLNLTNVMPILDANLGAAYREYMAGDLPKGAYSYVLSRHAMALSVLSKDELEPKVAYKSCALLAMDLRCGLQEPTMRTSGAESQVEAWWQCYRDAGYTEVNSFFNAPMLPSPLAA
ncbi:hypothetical protein [Pseudomonas serbica]|uniref:hypothetical protein n=1 Tax=Pseudomonas serbica TaxID=2965074 RepID=UPI00237A94F2|nr:hypothetical protein [Pseudomonas serbica]